MAPRTSTTESSGNTKIKWDGSPTTRYTWFENLQTVLDLESTQFRTLWERGYLIDTRGRVLTSSPDHSYHLQYDSVKTQPFDNPTLLGTFTPATADGKPLVVDPDAIDSRYVVALEVLRAKDREMFTIIADTITNSRRRKDYEAASSGSGTQLIKILAEELRTSSAEHSQYAARQMAALVEAGISAPTVVAFDLFREAYQNWNAQLPKARRLADSVVADVYVAAAYNLGELLHTRIDLLLQQSGGHGDLEVTVKCIIEVLEKYELSHVGRAFKTDPRRTVKPNPSPRIWIDGKDDPCSICEGKIDGGRHLRINCPSRSEGKSNKPKEYKGDASRKSGAKLATGKLYPSLDPEGEGHPDEHSDCRLADLFSFEFDELKTDQTDSHDEAPPTQTGSAFVARPTAPRSDACSTDTPVTSKTAATPSSGAASAVRRLSELTALSPMKNIREVESELQTGVTLRTGGSDHRTRRDILSDMRSAVGLPPLAVPFGLPVETKLESTCDHPITPPNPAREVGTASTPTQSAMSNPLGIVHSLGCPQLVRFSIECDTDGCPMHLYTFTYSNEQDRPLVYGHLAPTPPSRPSAPSNSRLLGRSPDGLTLFWGQTDGGIVACPIGSTATAMPRLDPDAERAPNRANNLPNATTTTRATGADTSRSRTSPVRDATLVLVSVIGTLAAMVIANAEKTGHDPGTYPPLHDAPPRRHSFPYLAFACTLVACVLTEAVHVYQANRGGGERPPGANPMPKPPSNVRWVPLYYVDRTTAWRALYESLTDGAAPWRVLFFMLEWIVLVGLCRACNSRQLKMSSRGFHRPMLYCRRPRNASALRDVAWLFCLLASLLPFGLAGRANVSNRSCPASRDAGEFGHSHSRPDPQIRHACNPSAGADFSHDIAALRQTTCTCSTCPSTQIPNGRPGSRRDEVARSSDGIVHFNNLSDRETKRFTRSVRQRDAAFGRAFAATRKRVTRKKTDTSPPHWRTSARTRRWVECVIDSGSTWHIHNNPFDLVNTRSCSDVVEDAAGNPTRCTHIGDLPLLVRDDRGREVTMLLHSVRCSTGFSDTLISVDQLWTHARVDCVFRDSHHLSFTLNCDSSGEPLRVPFRRTGGLFRLNAATLESDPAELADSKSGLAFRLRQGIHASTSTSHVSSLPADTLASLLHRRLHIGSQHIRRLGKLASDVPEHISSASDIGCEHCAAANATRLPHSGDAYRPTHAGRLVHGDVAGPFKPSYGGGYRYCLILTDDHTRFKWVYFLHKKSDVNNRTRKFLNAFRALANQSSNVPIQPVGSLRTDRAGELISQEFTELLDQEGVHHITSPPYVHQLNGVAERSIRSTFSLVRSYLVASQLSPAFWTFAAEMAIDVLNRTTGPELAPNEQTSYEMLTGQPARVLSLMPFGCRAFAVKPREQYSKTTIDPRAWIGTNLGRDPSSPSCFRIYVPSTGRIVSTSDAYFMEHVFPHRPRGAQTDDSAPAVPTRAPGAELSENEPINEPPLLAGFAQLASCEPRNPPPSKVSRSVLLLFSGPYNRPDGIAALLRRRGIEVIAVDNCPKLGDPTHDLLNDAFFSDLYARAREGHFSAIFAAPPCSTYSVARYFQPKGSKSGAPPVRSRDHILGLPELPPGHQREVSAANEITRRTALILQAGRHSGAEFAIENPADRGDPTSPLLFHFPEHGPIWLDPSMQRLHRSCSLHSTTFAQCMLGGPSQKYTTLWYTAGISGLHRLDGLICSHSPGTHDSPAGGVYRERPDSTSGTWNSAESAAYPAEMNILIADALFDSIITSTMYSGARSGDAVNVAQPFSGTPTPTNDVQIKAATNDQVAAPPAPAVDLAALPVVQPQPAADAIAADGLTNDAHAEPSSSEHVDHKPKPNVFVRGLGEIATRSRRQAFLARKSGNDPSNHWEAMDHNSAGWSAAESKEIANHSGNGSWTYILRSELPSGRRIVKLTWVYKTKRNKELKARLCVQGCSQVAGVDYDQTFCAAMRAGSLRVLCAIAARLGLSMRRWDFVAAYLQGELEPGEVVYCSPPPGYTTKYVDGAVILVPRGEGDGVERLCRVERPVYGMAQAGRRWQRTIFPWLLDWKSDGASLKQSAHDSCIFQCRHQVRTPTGHRTEWLLVGCYVDDLFILSSHTDEHSLYSRFTSALTDKWDVEDEGEVSDLLSIEISAEPDHVTLRQSRYIEKLLDTYTTDGVPVGSLATSKLRSHQPSRTPCGPELPQLVADSLTQSASDINPTLLKQYQSLVGALLYCAVNTRPDVAYTVGMLCRAMGKPTVALLDAAYRALYYLYHHRSVGLRYSACETDLSGMSDADWSAHYSTSGYIFQFSQAAISWGSKKQQSVALSSCEAEIMALSEAAKEGAYLTRFLTELGFPSAEPLPIHCDNTAARDLAYNPEHHERTKHIERRHFFVRDLVEEGTLVVPFVATTSNMADFFTKPLTASDFYRHRNAIMNVPARA